MTGTAGTLPAPSPRGLRPSRRGHRFETAVLGAAVVLIGASLALPWWAETESFGGSTWTQTFTPVLGVTGTCSPTCAPFSGPPFGPINGTQSFSSLGLNRTAELYASTLALVGIGEAFALIGLGLAVTGGPGPRSPRRARVRAVVLTVSLLALAVGIALLPVLQPMTMRADTTSSFAPNNAWTASPSPETSFWGSCTVGADHGACVSGGAAAWGPALGWGLLGIALVLLIAVEIRGRRRSVHDEELAPPRS